jgi:CSLREA domain-containing protein
VCFVSICAALAVSASLLPRWLGAVGVITSAAGNTITVNSTADVVNGSDGLCTLREAITAANSNTASGASAGECSAGSSVSSDSINISVTGTINLTGVLPDINSDMSINGPGSSLLTVRRNTGGIYRIFFNNNKNLSITGLTITNGRTTDGTGGIFQQVAPSGGGILQSGGVMVLTDVVVTANSTGNSFPGSFFFAGFGAGIYATGTLIMTNCVVSNNTTGNGAVGTDGSGGRGAGIFFETGTLTLQNVTITGNRTGQNGGTGGVSGSGGGLWTGGGGSSGTFATTTMTNVTVTNNTTADGINSSAGEAAGMMILTGSATLTNSIVSNNHCGNSTTRGGGRGGGIDNAATLTITNSLISGNSTGNGVLFTDDNIGGGIMNGYALTLINSTVSGNSTGTGLGRGGGIYGGPSLTIVNSTVTGNTTSFNVGNGVVAGNVTNIRNTIIAGNGPGGNGPDLDIGFNGSFTSQGHNLIGNPGGSGGFTNGNNGDQVGTSGSPLNPRLGPLANNGGPTQTHALLSTSPALDAGDDCVTQAAQCGDSNIPQLTTDQRGAGFNRIVDGPDADTTATVDIGAYETQPALANIPDTSSNEDTQVIVPFDAGDTSTITSITATSGNPILVPNDSAHRSAALTGSTGIVTINPATNLFGAANITVTVNRSVGGNSSKTFMLTVNSSNDAPTFTAGPDQSVNEDAGAQTITNWGTNVSPGPADESGQTLTFQVIGNTNAALFSVAPAISAAGTLTYTAAANANGSASITINLMDNGGTANGGQNTSATQTFVITVNPVNDAPSFIKGTDRTVNEDSGFQSISNWATSLSAGPPEEAGQTLTFQVTNNTNASLFSSAPTVTSGGTLVFSTAGNANGSATITIVLKDNGGTANGGVDTSAPQTFTITLTPVNDPPTFTRAGSPIVNEDAGAQTVTNFVTNISPGPANESGQTVSFSVTNNTNAALFSAAPAVSSTGTLTYTPAPNASGQATITLVAKDDGGTANGGVDTSTQTFFINVNEANDPPSFTKGADQTVNNNAGAQTIANWATNISPGPANESAQTVSFQVGGNSNIGLFAVEPAISPTGTLTYQPAAFAGGTATITITLRDNGGTANGGQDTSPFQTVNINVNPVGGSLKFNSDSANTTESSGSTTVTVTRTGDLSRAVTVDYATSGDTGLPCSTPGAASPMCDFTSALGTLKFAVGEDTKIINVLISQDSFVEGPETFNVMLSNQTGGSVLATPSTETIMINDDLTEPPTNPIDDAANFVRQHYHDFLNREPDAAGFAFWTNQITSCGSDQACIQLRRINVSAAFYVSVEFQETGYLVERIYKTAYGDASGLSNFGGAHQLSVPIVRANELLADTQEIGRGIIVNQGNWQQQLENNKQAFIAQFVQRQRFTNTFPASLTPAQFVDRLNTNAGNPLSQLERDQLVNELSINFKTRAQVLRAVAEDADLANAEFNRAFVLMQYFGYLRRNPNDPQDNDYTGYDFWLTKLNQFNGNFVNADMVKAFIATGEYRGRFGP